MRSKIARNVVPKYVTVKYPSAKVHCGRLLRRQDGFVRPLRLSEKGGMRVQAGKLTGELRKWFSYEHSV
jgi:hypothetical protein